MKKVILLLFLLSFIGCWAKAPVIRPGESKSCFKERECLYLFRNEPDKTYCLTWAERCFTSITYEYCKVPENWVTIKNKNKWGKTIIKNGYFSGCWEKLR